MSNIHQRSASLRTTANPSAVRNKYDPRVGRYFSHGIKPDNVHYPCPECGEIYYRVKYIIGIKHTECLRCGHEIIGEFKAVMDNI